MKPIAIAGASAALLLAGCASDTTSGQDDSGVVASTTIWGDVASQITRCAADTSATTLMPIGADPHDYSPSSANVAEMVRADLVIVNGLGLEEGLQSAVESAIADGANIVEVAPLLDPIPFGATGHGDDEEHSDDDGHSGGEPHAEEDGDDHAEEGGDDHAHDGDDPHVWLDAGRVADAAVVIGDALADATGDDSYATCGQQVSTDIRSTDEQVRQILAEVPAGQRVLVTDHDSFGYFAGAYDFDVIGVVVPGGSTLGDPSSAEVADLVATIQDAGVPAIFANTANPQQLADTIAGEAGNDVEVVELYVGSLGEPGSGAETYQSMILTNAQRISDALAG